MSNVILNTTTGVSVGASESDKVISRVWKARDNSNIRAKIVLSAVSETTAIAFKLQHSAGSGLWTDVGSEAEAAVATAKTFNAGAKESTTVTFPEITAATATLDLTTDIILTSVATGSGRNTETFTTQVAAAAANPTDTVLVDFTGTAAAITCTITPNDGTNNGATPVDLTTAELVELINTGAVAGKNVTVTDASSFRALQTATGGDATALADAGEGDNVVGTFASGAGATQGDGLLLTAVDGTTAAFWIDVDGNGTAPTGAWYTGADIQIQVAGSNGDTGSDLATAASSAIGSLLDADWTVGAPSGADIVFTQLTPGAVDDPAPKDSAGTGSGAVTVNVDTAGSDGNVAPSTDRLTISSHGYSTGDQLIYGDAGGTAPGGLVDGTIYYAIVVDSNTISLAASQSDAFAGTAIDITDAGVGNSHTFYLAELEIRMVQEDSSDYAQLPLYDQLRVVASTGTSDSCTVTKVLV